MKPALPSPAELADASTPDAAWHAAFSPRRWLRNGHAQTIAGNFLRRKAPLPALSEQWTLPVEAAHSALVDGRPVQVPETRILCLCHWQPEAVQAERLTVVLVHGLEGSANSGYVQGNTTRLWAEGCNVVRMNMRSCGGSDALAPTIYHSGRSEDVAAVVGALEARGLRRIALVGYSMGGNLVLRYAGEQSLLAEDRRARRLVAVAGVSPLMDLAPSSAALHLPSNRLYEARFLRAMKRRLRAKAVLFPELYQGLEGEGVYRRMRTMRDFDGEIVARFGGFRDADDYYEQVRASRFAAAFALPTFILHAADDPFIRTLAATRSALLGNPQVTYVETRHGGHCAFLADPRDGDDGRWAEDVAGALAAGSRALGMIADWTVDVGPETPLIVLPWEGWVDLRGSTTPAAWPQALAAQLPEVAAYPELLTLLAAANTDELASAKVDVFPVDRDDVDPEIAEAGLAATAFGLSSYIDLVARRRDHFRNFRAYEQVARAAVLALRGDPLPCALAEIVVRPAQLYDKQTFGWTLYATGFGPNPASARATWAQCAATLLAAFGEAAEAATRGATAVGE